MTIEISSVPDQPGTAAVVAKEGREGDVLLSMEGKGGGAKNGGGEGDFYLIWEV